MPLIVLDHTRLDTVAYIARMRELHAALNGNSSFPGLAAQVTAFDTLVTQLETDHNACLATAIQARDQAAQRESTRTEVERAVRALAFGCEAAQPDNVAALQSGGWRLRGARSTVGPMTAPQNLAATTGDMEGEVDCQWQPVNGRDTYLAEHATSAAGPWTQFYVGSKSSCTASGLTGGQLYWFRVRAVGAAGPGPWSDPAQARAM